MKIVMTGATGYIGGKVLEQLVDEDHQVYAVVRNESRLYGDIRSAFIISQIERK